MTEIERLMKQLHREANPDATSRADPHTERIRLCRSKELALERSAALFERLNVAATAGATNATQRLVDESQLHYDAARGFGELIADIDVAVS